MYISLFVSNSFNFFRTSMRGLFLSSSSVLLLFLSFNIFKISFNESEHIKKKFLIFVIKLLEALNIILSLLILLLLTLSLLISSFKSFSLLLLDSEFSPIFFKILSIFIFWFNFLVLFKKYLFFSKNSLHFSLFLVISSKLK